MTPLIAFKGRERSAMKGASRVFAWCSAEDAGDAGNAGDDHLALVILAGQGPCAQGLDGQGLLRILRKAPGAAASRAPRPVSRPLVDAEFLPANAVYRVVNNDVVAAAAAEFVRRSQALLRPGKGNRIVMRTCAEPAHSFDVTNDAERLEAETVVRNWITLANASVVVGG